jgi:hypothetical protein
MIALAALSLAALFPQEWPVGVEREVDEGFYMQVFAADHGWRVWRTENRNGVFCKAIKPASGRSDPVPVGVANLMSRETPFVEVSWTPVLNTFHYEWGATHYGGVRGKYRVPGERFWEDSFHGDIDLRPAAGKTIEVVVESYRYPELGVGRAEESGTVDLVGLEWALAEVIRCGAS